MSSFRLKRHKVSHFAIFSICVLLFPSGCTFLSTQKSVYDDDKAVAKENDTYTYLSRVGTITNEKMDLEYRGFMGMETIWSFEVVNEGDITLEYDSSLVKGRFKGVLVADDGKITTVFEGKTQGEFVLKSKSYRFKLVGDNARGNIKIKINQLPGSESIVDKYYKD